MKTKLFAALIVASMAGSVYADDDRFGSDRFEVPRTSYTESSDRDVLIASAPVNYSGYGGELYLKPVECFGVNPATITFYDTVTFQSNTSTRTKYIHGGGCAGTYTKGNYSMLFSSGLMYNKIGNAPCTIRWDYTTNPRHALKHY